MCLLEAVPCFAETARFGVTAGALEILESLTSLVVPDPGKTDPLSFQAAKSALLVH